MLELWPERGVRHCKEVVHGHVSKDPETTYANTICRLLALAKLRLQHPQLLCAQTPATNESPTYNDGERDGAGVGTQMVGKGKKPSEAEQEWLREMLCQAIRDARARGWDLDDGETVDNLVEAAFQGDCVHMYNMADIRGQDLVRPQASVRGGARPNHWVWVRWQDPRDRWEKPYVCAVQCLVRMSHPSNANADVLPVAGVQVYNPMPVHDGLLAASGTSINRAMYPVALSSIDSKLVCACSMGQYLVGRMHFMPYFNISKTY